MTHGNITLRPLRDYRATHFRWDASADGNVATITLDRPERKNPLTFDAYAELRDLFRALVYASDVQARRHHRRRRQLLLGRRRARDHRAADEDGDARAAGVHADDRRSRARRCARCPQPIVAAIDGICAGAGAMIAMACDLRFGTPAAQDRVPVHPRRASPAATWARARCCRASSGRAAPPSCSTPAAR